MSSVCFYFQVHQPYRIGRYSYFDANKSLLNKSEKGYFDQKKNAEVMRKVAKKCYLPTNTKMLELIKRFEGRFKIAYSITGVAIDQMKEYAPEVLDSFKYLAETGCVEFIGETYYHSLAALYDVNEFKQQVQLHSDLMKQEFGVKPKVFRNTELIYSDYIGSLVQEMGFDAVIAEGADDILGWRSPNFIYQVANCNTEKKIPKLLLKNYRLSDDIAFRFSNQGWSDYPLTADKFAGWVHKVSGNGDVVNLFMDYETFGEHQWESTGIFDFLDHLPHYVLQHTDWNFMTPSEVIASYPVVSDMPFHRLTSWADMERDTTAWQGNGMQNGSLSKIYALANELKRNGNPKLLEDWRKLLTSDHFYYMCTKWFADGDVHAYFSPYESPYEAFINYANVLRSLETKVAADQNKNKEKGADSKEIVAADLISSEVEIRGAV